MIFYQKYVFVNLAFVSGACVSTILQCFYAFFKAYQYLPLKIPEFDQFSSFFVNQIEYNSFKDLS